MAEAESAPATGQPDANVEVGQPDWQAERERLTSELAELRSVSERQRQQIAGSQKTWQELQARGVKSPDEVIQRLERLDQLTKRGFDVERLSQALKPDDEPAGSTGFDPAKFKAELEQELFSKWEQHQTSTAQRRELEGTLKGIGDAVKKAYPDVTARDHALAESYVRDQFFDHLSSGLAPGDALQKGLEKYAGIVKEAQAQTLGSELSEIATAANKSSKSAATKKGGQGNPKTDTDQNPEKGFMGVDRARLAAEVSRRMNAASTGRTSALS